MTRFPVAVRPLERLAALHRVSRPPARSEAARTPHSHPAPRQPAHPPINNPRRTTDMTQPARIQRRRVSGWRKPDNCVIVTRPSRFGNPFIVGMDATDRAHATALYREWLEHNSYDVHPPGVPIEYRQAMDDRRDWIITHAVELRGRDLACWCPLPAEGQPDHCHAAVLLDLANQPAA